jgi:thiol-disulfide isomerase/thioredoxin
MEKTLKLLIMIVLFIGLLVGAMLLYTLLGKNIDTQLLATEPAHTQSTDPSTTTEALDSAPDFEVVDRDGTTYRLSDFKGKPVVLNFWASWCGPCKSEMPDFQAAYEKYGDSIHFLMVNLTDGAQESMESASTFMDKTGYTFPVYYDTAGNASMTYGVYSLPTTFFIDAEGHAIAQAVGAIDAETLQRGIDMIVNK